MRFLLIDATSYLFRAFHAMGDFRTAKGTPTGAIMGVLNMLHKIQEQYPSEHIACIMDAPGKTFRHHLSPDYKANRPPLNEDLRLQIEPLKSFIRAWGLPLICHPGVEADDVIATLARQGQQSSMTILIVSADKDLMQLINDNLSLFDGYKNKIYDSNAVVDKFGVMPRQMGDYLALVGDASDNIRGVDKIGAKTAAKLLNEFDTLANIIQKAQSESDTPPNNRTIKGAAGDNLRAAAANGVLALAQQLIALKTDVDLPQTVAECRLQSPNHSEWQNLCQQYEFRRHAELLDKQPPVVRAAAETLQTLPQLQTWIDNARRAGVVALDTETDGAPPMSAKLVGFSLSIDGKTAVYVPLAHVHGKQIAAADALQTLRPLLQDESVKKIFHNGKYDLHIFANNGESVCGVIEDTKIAAAVIAPATPNSLSALAQTRFNIKMLTYRELVDGKIIKDFSQVALESATQYAAADAEMTFKLHADMTDNLTDTARQLYETIDRPLMPVLYEIERIGVRIDGAALLNFAEELRERMASLEQQAHALAGGAFNLNSPRQLETLLFDKMGATPLHKTIGGKARSTDERTLDKLAADYPLARVVREHRELAKLVGTYAEKLPQMINRNSGRIHTDFNQTSVITGRLASGTPNLQNIPVRTADGRRIRRAFVAAAGYTLISADYSQIELRLMAHIADEPALLQAFAAGADIHRRTAAEVFELEESAINAEQRRAAKAINFGLIYGMSAFGLARSLNISQQQAREYIRRYFLRYPQVAAFMDNIRAQAKQDGYVTTITGRRIPLLSGNLPSALRAAINAPMQGGAADIIKMAMLKTHAWLHQNNMQTRMILQVHDELVFESPTAEAEEMCANLPKLMCDVIALKTPLEISINRADNWDDAH